MKKKPFGVLVSLLTTTLSLVSWTILYAQNSQFSFERISLIQGLSQTTVNCIIQDSKGFMWIGTEDGLNRYDGYDFTIYKNDPYDLNSISNNKINSICEDTEGFLWVATGNGLNKYNQYLEKFETYESDTSNITSLTNNHISTVYVDESGTVWIGDIEGGLYKYDRINDSFISYSLPIQSQHLTDSNSFQLTNRVNAIFEDKSGILWVGTGMGLYQYDPPIDSFFLHQIDDPEYGVKYGVNTFFEDMMGELLIGMGNKALPYTYGGLALFDRNKSTFNKLFIEQPEMNKNVNSIYEYENGNFWLASTKSFRTIDRSNGDIREIFNNPTEPSSVSNNRVTTFYEDRAGILWIGTEGGGLNKHDSYREPFSLYRNNPKDTNRLGQNIIRSSLEDQYGNLWVGTQDGGLHKMDQNRVAFTQFDLGTTGKDKSIWSLVEDQFGSIWIGTRWEGIMEYDPSTGNINKHPFEHRVLTRLYEDKKGTIWVGSDKGLSRFDKENKKFIRFDDNLNSPGSLTDDHIKCLFEDSFGEFWVGTLQGLNKMDKSQTEIFSGTFTKYYHDQTKPNSLSGNHISVIHEDQFQNLWIGTYGQGLNRYNRDTDDFTRYSGLPNDVIYGILDDEDGNLWISSNMGISRYNPKTMTAVNYDESDQLQGLEFNMGAYYKSRSGEMFFGGMNGLNTFFPARIKGNMTAPQLTITDFKIFNKSVPIGEAEDGRTVLNRHISYTPEITLLHTENVFSIEFAALDYTESEANQYAYMIEGIDDDWNDIGTNRFIPFSNLKSGEYVISIKGSNSDGYWNEEGISLKINILPPWWQTWWAKTLYVVMLTSSVYSIVTWRTNSLKKTKILLETQVEDRTRELNETNKSLLGANKQIQENRDRLGLAMTSTKMGTWDYYVTEGRLEFDKAKLALFGLNSETFDKKMESWVATIHKGDIEEVVKNVESSIENSSPMDIDYRIYLPNREIRFMTTKGLFFNHGEGKSIRAMGLTWDITEQKLFESKLALAKEKAEEALQQLKETQTQLIQSEKMASLGQLTAGVAHEINNPVNFVKVGAEALKRDFHDLIKLVELYRTNSSSKVIQDHMQQMDLEFVLKNVPEILKDIESGTARTAKIVKGLQSFAQLDVSESSKADIHECMDSALALISEEETKHIKFIRNYQSNIPPVTCYQGPLIQAFLNLITNARDAMPDGGTLIVTTSENEHGLLIRFKDTGVGIPNDVLEKIFDPFFTTKPTGQGTGLGLSITHGIVEKHGGKIEVKSKVGKGTTFEIQIPLKLEG